MDEEARMIEVLGRDITTEDALKAFALNFEKLLEKKNVSRKWLGENTEYSYPHISNVASGKKAATAEFVLSIKEALNLSQDDVASLSIIEDSLTEDADKWYVIAAVLPYKGTERISGNIIVVEEKIIRQYYPELWVREDFGASARKYLYETHFKKKFEEIIFERHEKNKIDNALDLKNPQTGLLREIVETIYNLDNAKLHYIKDMINLYLEHYKK